VKYLQGYLKINRKIAQRAIVRDENIKKRKDRKIKISGENF